MNDEIERLNEENRKQNEYVSPGNQSKAGASNITSPDEDKRSIAEGIIADLSNQRADIDVIKQTVDGIATQVNIITQALYKIVNGQVPQVQGQPIQTPEQGKINMETISLIGDLFEKGAAAYKSLKGNDSVVDTFTQQITDNAKAEAIESLNIVHLINKKVKGKLVQDIASDIAGGVMNDANKQNSHEPQ